MAKKCPSPRQDLNKWQLKHWKGNLFIADNIDRAKINVVQVLTIIRMFIVNFLFQLVFIFPLFLGMVMYANEFKTKEKQKKINCNIYKGNSKQTNVIFLSIPTCLSSVLLLFESSGHWRNQKPLHWEKKGRPLYTMM